MPKVNSGNDKTGFLKRLNLRKTAQTGRDNKSLEPSSHVLIVYSYENTPKPKIRGLLEHFKNDSFSRSDDSVGFESVHIDLPPSVDNKPINHDLESIKEEYDFLKRMAKSRFKTAKKFMGLGSKADAASKTIPNREHLSNNYKQTNDFHR